MNHCLLLRIATGFAEWFTSHLGSAQRATSVARTYHPVASRAGVDGSTTSDRAKHVVKRVGLQFQLASQPRRHSVMTHSYVN